MSARHLSTETLTKAPDWHVSQWFNTQEDLTLESLRGKVVAMVAFQMLCPGCVSGSLPQAQELARLFQNEDIAIIGFHTVFEHHAAMTPVSLQAFLHEYRITFPVAVDAPGKGGEAVPKTMAAYEMQGTPTLVLIDRQGRRRLQAFSHVPDLRLGAALAKLLAESGDADMPVISTAAPGEDHQDAGSADGKCSI